MIDKNTDRRAFLSVLGTAGVALVGGEVIASGKVALAGGPDEQSMSPNEDMMQEHALLNRVLLIYEESIRRLTGKDDLNPEILKRAAQTIKNFVEEYHEKLEEDYVFPRFEKAKKLTDLVATLRQQHKAGRAQTQAILALATSAGFKNDSDRTKLVDHLRAFIRMYRPHEAREGSVLYPAFRDLIPAHEFNELGDMFEKKEHEVLGSEGFEGQVGHVAELEKALGIHDLGQFTPKA